uniref:Uncharacterized protein n=1 Tax=Anguilla anguilla TaxID=7936 RepID=A0A0E9T148_ANGAN
MHEPRATSQKQWSFARVMHLRFYALYNKTQLRVKWKRRVKDKLLRFLTIYLSTNKETSVSTHRPIQP